MPDRRSFLSGLVVLAVPQIASAAPSGADPIPALLAVRRRAIELVNDGHYATEDDADALMDKWGACDAAVIASPATTPAGAIASLEWAREELLQFGFRADKEDNGTRLVLSLLDGALGVLRDMGGAA